MQQFSCETVADLAVPGLATGRLTVIAVHGVADTTTGTALASALAAPGPAQLVVDLTGLYRLEPAGAEILYRFAEEAAARGRPLRLTGCSAQAAAVLAGTRAAREPAGRAGPELYGSVSEALAAVISAAAAAPEPPPGAPFARTDAVELRHRLLAHALVARAQGLLMERYGLPGADTAGALLRTVARRHGMRTVALAGALMGAAAPGPGEAWFPGREHPAEPAVGFLLPSAGRARPLSAFLDALRDTACAITHTDMANVQLLDPSDNTLRMESHCGFPAEFVHFFAVVDGTATPCGHAARKSERIVVDDVASAPEFDEPSRAATLAAHSRSVQCTPIPGPAGRAQGMLSTHHAQAGHAFTGAEFVALDTVAREAGAWLDWYRTTTVLDALEDLHRRAQGP
ncbi:ANTAR domain-containing protein [Streptomyces sp. NPDC052292]|uniref:ANTAR domain-containing protein n=1 Tax=Streptomyces sp. NPDC052292 TaxID=3155053 RepID=UPI0034386463